MLERAGNIAEAVINIRPWTNVYGFARSLLALGTGLTLITNDPLTLFSPAAGIPAGPHCHGPATLGLFCLFPESLSISRWVAIAILGSVISGWKPRITCIPHWWVSFSFNASATELDGGDQIAAVVTLLIIPIALTDARTWHWSRCTSHLLHVDTGHLLGATGLIAIRIQVSLLYFHAAVAKFGVHEWADGTATYYILSDPLFGVPDILRPLIVQALHYAPVVAAITWGTIILEFAIFLALFLPRTAAKKLLIPAIVFHGFIAALMGLITFGLAACAALILYLRPPEDEFPVWLPQLSSAPLQSGGREEMSAL